MKNFFESDYARNKKSTNIVCHFATGDFEITPEAYLAENPGETEDNFSMWKAISDGMYLGEDREENAKGHKNISLHSLVNVSDPTTPPPDVQMEAEEVRRERELESLAVEQFVMNGKMTAVQHRRFCLYYYEGLSTRKIAAREGVRQCTVMECIQACEKKLKKYLRKHPVTPLVFLR